MHQIRNGTSMLDEVIRTAWQDALDDLAFDDRRFDGAAAAPRIPGAFSGLLASALAESEGVERDRLVEYHGRMLQRMRAEVVACADEPQRTLLHTPLDLAAMPRLCGALEALFTRVRAAGVDPRLAFGAPDPHALIAARPTVAALFAESYYGGYGPPLYLSPPDLAALARELREAPSVLSVIDHRLSAPLVHELSHFRADRRPLASPYLDECVAAWVGASAYPAIALPEPGDDAAMYLAAWFVQVGAHLARLFGEHAVMRAHAGVDSWDDVLPRGLETTLARLAWEQWRAGRQLSFLGTTSSPDPWIKAFWLAAAGRLPPDVSLDALERWPWSELPRGPWSEADDALLAWGRSALRTEPLVSPEGAWRVMARPVPTFVDRDGRIRRAGVTYPLEHTALHVVAPPGSPVDAP